MIISIYACYGVLGHENRPFYCVKPASDIYDRLSVILPDEYQPCLDDYSGDIYLTIDNELYNLDNILANRGDDPIIVWQDRDYKKHYKKLVKA